VTQIVVVTILDGPVERAFDLARDITVHERTLARTGERAVAGRTQGPIGPGEVVTFQARHLGVRWTLTSRVNEADWDPPRGFVDEQVKGPFRWFRHEHRFEAAGTTTRMTDVWTHELGWGALGRLVDRLVVTRTARGLLAERAAALARLASS
jgi:ligand-binding SRPBCC domain-containing protein